MKTNHPAHGPVSLDRLHQISEILSKAAAQSDGGNLGYAMADAVKVINGAIAAFGAEPVGTFRKGPCGYHPSFHEDAVPLYAAPPAPVVPEELLSAMEEVLRISDRNHEAWHKARNGIAACRAAMLQAGNSPVTPDGWVACSERMPEKDDFVYIWPRPDFGVELHVAQYGKFDKRDAGWYAQVYEQNFGIEYHPITVTHWMPLPAAPQQEVKSAFEHGMQRYAGAMQKLSEGDK
ncbi:TPA: DUF551 domain-containing protein [Citrobacter freundii]